MGARKNASVSLLMDYKKGKLSPQEKNQVIMEYAPLIKFIAQKIASRLPSNIELDDLVSSGAIGLMDAIEKYNPERDNKFKTYAEFRIRGAMLDELRAQDWVPRSVRDKAKMLNRVVMAIEAQTGQTPGDEEIADKLNIPMEEYYSLVNQVRPVSMVSIDDQATFSNVDKKSLLGLLQACRINDPHNNLDDKVIKEMITRTIGGLPERQRLVLSLYYYEDLNLREIGKILRVTESRVSQLHAQAISRLKLKLTQRFEQVVAQQEAS